MELNNKTESLKENGKTFYWASKLIDKKKFNDISELYYILRDLDDIADNEKNEKNIFEDIKRYLENEAYEFIDTRMDKHLVFINSLKSDINAKKVFLTFIDGLMFDQKSNIEIKNTDELINYCYKVAGTVGIMMCPILGTDNDKAKGYAADLGIAMQLTNISRDVFEDACSNRKYLPSDICENIDSKKIKNIFIEKDEKSYLIIKDTIRSILILADRYYDRAKNGYHYLPFRSRVCISVAANIYREIGILIKKNNYNWSDKRYFVPNYKKLIITVKTLFLESFQILFK